MLVFSLCMLFLRVPMFVFISQWPAPVTCFLVMMAEAGPESVVLIDFVSWPM